MTVTPEMREAGRLEFAKGNALDTIDGWFEPADIYLAMRALDPEVAELRRKVADHEAECITLGLEIKALREDLTGEASGYEEMLSAKNGWADRARSAETFLASQGYTRGEDGTWSATLARAVAELRELTAHADLEAQLASLRAKYDAITQDAASGVETVPSVEHYYEGLLDKREAELAALHEFLRARGYAKGEDGTWGKMG